MLQKSSRTFENARAYLAALADDPALAIIPKSMAEEVLGVQRPAVAAQVKSGKLPSVKVGSKRHLLAWGLIERLRDYERKVARVRRYLESVGAARETVFYEPVMSLVGLSTSVPQDRGEIGAILASVSREVYQETESEEEHGILLSVLVHRKTQGKTRPGPGFFNLAEKMGFEWNDDDEFVQAETERAWVHYSKPTSR